MRVELIERTGGPERLACEAELIFDEPGPLHGLKLVGFSLWRGPAGDVYCTFPSRSFGAGNERRFFDYLRAADDSADARGIVRRVKDWIVGHYLARVASVP
jgi:hypothetical protein